MSHRSLTRIVLFCAIVSAGPLLAQERGIWQSNTLTTPLITAVASREQVRFSALALAQRMRLEVLSQSGELLYDSGFRPGNLLEWTVQNQQGFALPDGLHGCLVTVEDLYGRVSQRRGIFRVADGAATFQMAEGEGGQAAVGTEESGDLVVLRAEGPLPFTFVSHDGREGWIESGSGGLSFYAGSLSRQRASIPHLRITPEGNVGIGVREPAAKLDVNGLIRTSEGIMFSDGTVQKTAAGIANTTGSGNAIVGVWAGVSNTTEDNNTFIGTNSDGAALITNATAIGYRAKVAQSNSLVLGGVNGVNGATAETNVGIGVTNPDRQLTVEGTQALGRFRRFYGTADPFTHT